MSESSTADAAATTDWTTYDGPVPAKFMFHAVFFPVVMGVLILMPIAVCYFCLSRSRVTPYEPPNGAGVMGARFDSKRAYSESINHGSVAEK